MEAINININSVNKEYVIFTPTFFNPIPTLSLTGKSMEVETTALVKTKIFSTPTTIMRNGNTSLLAKNKSESNEIKDLIFLFKKYIENKKVNYMRTECQNLSLLI